MIRICYTLGNDTKRASLTVVGVRAVRTIVNYLNTEPVMTDSVSAKICHNDIMRLLIN